MGRGTFGSMFVSFMLLMTIPDLSQPCIHLLEGWKPISVGERAKLVTVVFIGKVRQLHPVNAYQTYAADFEVLRVLKGRNVVEEVMKFHQRAHLKVFGFGEKRLCRSPVQPGEIHMVFAIHWESMNSLVARYADIFGATSSATKENEDEVLEALGWRPWSSWTLCTANCGGGAQWRTRKCKQQECNGTAKERRKCNNFECYGLKDVMDYLRKVETKVGSHYLEKRKMIKLEENKFLSLPTTRVFQYYFPDHMSIIITFRPLVFLDLYLVAIYNVGKALQLGVRIMPDTVVFEFQGGRAVSFEVSMRQGEWHSLALSVQGQHVSLFWDCQKTQAKSLTGMFSFTPDPAGITYFGQSPYSALKERFEVELGELQFVPDPSAAKEKCQVSSFMPALLHIAEGSGGGPSPTDGDEGSGTTNYIDDNDNEVELSWSPWSSCSKTCGKGSRKRFMTCDFELNREPGEECHRALQTEQVKECHLMDCPAHCDRPCLNGGFCQRRNTCKCQQGFYGDTCEKVRCQLMCLNGGTCVGPLKCRCPPGYSGIQCERAACSPPCRHGGACVRPNVCRCPAGYLPPTCQPSCYPPCLNGGECVGPNTCRCPRMFTGSTCKQAVCTQSCLNGGRCYAPDKCSCSYGWRGKKCEQAECFPHCKNGGQCIRPNVCRCPRGTFGFYCQHRTRH